MKHNHFNFDLVQLEASSVLEMKKERKCPLFVRYLSGQKGAFKIQVGPINYPVQTERERAETNFQRHLSAGHKSFPL